MSENEWLPDELERRAAVERGEAVSANLKRDERLIQWAKQRGKLHRVDRLTRWGNPFRIGKDGDRDAVCDRYRGYLQTEPELLKALPELRGKVLACFCYPERCHADELRRASELPAGAENTPLP